MKQAHKTEELTLWQITLEEARNAICPRNNPEFHKHMGTLLDEDQRWIASTIFSQRLLMALLMSGVRPSPGFRWPSFQCAGKLSFWSR